MDSEPIEKVSSSKKRGRQSIASVSLTDNSVTPNSAKRNRVERGYDNNLPSIKKMAESMDKDPNYNVPALSLSEQLSADLATSDDGGLKAGTRVLALWSNEFYAAYVCGTEGLGRYYILFAEDNIKRILPKTGIIPIADIKPGSLVSFMSMQGDDEFGKVAEVVTQPSRDNLQQWFEGVFELSWQENMPNEKVVWTKMYLTKDQSSAYLNKKVDKELIVSGARRTRSQFGSEKVGTPASDSKAGKKTSTPRQPKAKNITSDETPRQRKPNDIVETQQQKTKDVVDTHRQTRSSDVSVLSETLRQPKGTNVESPRSLKTFNVSPNARQTKSVEATSSPRQSKMDDRSPSPRKAKTNDSSPVPRLAKTNDSSPTRRQAKTSETLVKIQEDSVVNEESTKSEMEEPRNDVVIQSNGTNDNGNGIPELIMPTLPTPKEQQVNIESKPSMVFKGLTFLLTSAPRANKKSDFNKRDYRQIIEKRGGEIMDSFENLSDSDSAYLIADTYYRTHKYLCALSLSVPCVSVIFLVTYKIHKWISECVDQDKLVDHHSFLLPAGESQNANVIYDWKPLKGKLLSGKTVMIYSSTPPSEDDGVIPFTDVWSPMLKNLGANLMETFQISTSIEEKLAFLESNPVDIFLTDGEIDKKLVQKIESSGLVVSSEFIIQAIIAGELPNMSECIRHTEN